MTKISLIFKKMFPDWHQKGNKLLDQVSKDLGLLKIQFSTTVEPVDSKPTDSKLQAFVNFLLLTKISNHSINHMIDSKHMEIANIFAPLKKLLKPGSTVPHYLLLKSWL